MRRDTGWRIRVYVDDPDNLMDVITSFRAQSFEEALAVRKAWGLLFGFEYVHIVGAVFGPNNEIVDTITI